jgi:hypothetical protein
VIVPAAGGGATRRRTPPSSGTGVAPGVGSCTTGGGTGTADIVICRFMQFAGAMPRNAVQFHSGFSNPASRSRR